MAKAPVAEFITAVRQSQVLENDQLEELSALAAKLADPRDLQRHAIKNNWLTPYQVNQIGLGKGSDLVLGQYILLERLGEGGMGQVFKARQRRLDRIVALKIIRKEKLEHPKAIDRFKREIRAAGMLQHENIVMAFDADQVGQTHFFAMEYVNGVDLARLVKDYGPIPLEHAVDYTRQAAVGLQHACERGLVHRDIKPANLLITPPPTPPRWGGKLKILDMGLARLNENRSEDELASRLTQEGTVMGTPDFIAPEQAMNSNTADIRADLYSLGCTFYFILTAKVPFPGGTMMEKIIRHRSEAFVPIELLRGDLPRPVIAIINRLLVKKPEDRFQTPSELADALQAALRGGPTRAPGGEATLVSVTGLSEATSFLPGSELGGPRPRWKTGWRRWLAIGIGLLILLLILRGIFKKSDDGNGKGPGKSPAPVTLASLDKLDAAKVPAAKHHPDEVVAVLGKPSVQPLKTFGLAFAPDGALAAANEDNFAHLFTFPGGSEQTLEPAFRGAARQVVVSKDGKLLAAASPDGQVALWSLAGARPKLVTRWQACPIGVDAIAFHPDGKRLASGGGDHFIMLWDITREPPVSLRKVGEHDGAVLSLDFAPDGKSLASGGQDNGIRIWNPEQANGSSLVLTGHDGDVRALAYAPDGLTLASGSEDNTVRLWDVKSHKATKMEKHTGAVTGVAFSPDGRWLASSGRDGLITVWDTGTNTYYRTWTLPWAVQAVAFAADSKHLATANGDGTLFILRLKAK